jgi:VWFA-related protein
VIGGAPVDAAFLRAAAMLHAEAAFQYWRSGTADREGARQLDLGRALIDITTSPAEQFSPFRRTWYLSTTLIFSDGDDTASWNDPRDVLAIARRSDVVVYSVTLGARLERADPAAARQDALERQWSPLHPRAYGRQFLPLPTADTGGALLRAERTQQLRETFARVVAEFKSRYVLMYTPRGVAPDGWHALDVRVKGRDGRVTARRGYLRYDKSRRQP